MDKKPAVPQFVADWIGWLQKVMEGGRSDV